MSRRRSPTALTDAQWAILEPLVPPPKPGGRPPKHPRRRRRGPADQELPAMPAGFPVLPRR